MDMSDNGKCMFKKLLGSVSIQINCLETEMS